MKKDSKNILIIISILIVFAIIIALCIYIVKIIVESKDETEKSENTAIITTNNTEEDLDKARDEKLSTSTETTRIKNYIGRFFSELEARDYEKAYESLFESFRNNYFPTIEEFKNYVVDKYPSNMVLEYINVGREGDIFVVSLKIIDGLNTTNAIEQRIVVQEKDLNSYSISFQVN